MPTPDHDIDDDAHWFELLAGRHVDQPDRRTAQEAAWLRAALLAYREAAPVGGPTAPEQRSARLIERARAAGLLPPAHAARSAGQAMRWHRVRWPLAAALAALALVVLPWSLLRAPVDDGGTALRGEALQTRRSANPAAEREALRAALQEAGIAAAPYERLDRLGLDLELVQPLTPAQTEALRRLGVALPAGPSLQIEFVAVAPAR